MSIWYKKYEDHTLDYQGKKYFEKKFVVEKMTKLLNTAENYQKRSHDADKLLMQMFDHWFVRLFFKKKIMKHLKKYKDMKMDM